MMTFFQRFLVIAVIVLSTAGCDQATKSIAKNYLTQPVSFPGDIFRLQYTLNTGAFLSLGSTLPASQRFWLLTIATGLFVAGMLIFILLNRSLKTAFVIGFSLIIGGGIGNLIDRAANHGAVIDFMNIGIGSLRTGIFNVADVAIMLGEGLLIILFLRRRGTGERSSDHST